MTVRRHILMLRCFAAAAALLPLLAGCRRGEHPQSALQPQSPAAHTIVWLWWLMFYLFMAIFLMVLFLALVAILRHRRSGAPGRPLGTKFIVTGGIVLPTVILLVLLVFNLRSTVALSMPPTEFTIRVTGHQWWWEVEYPEWGIIDANELHIPVNTPVKLELIARDVIHSFWVPRLQGKRDLIPDHVTTFWIQSDRTGVYRGQCAEYCGVQHALMAFEVVVSQRDEFERWVQHRRQPPPPPQSERLRHGQQVFMNACANCHAVEGTPAIARIGPDMTHMGARRTIGAGTFPNTRGYLTGWIANPQPLKPGNLMPPSYLASEDLHALVEYIESLK